MRHPSFSHGRFTVAVPAVIAATIVAVMALPAQAQDEAALRAFFEGKRVALKIDMPGTSDGVDVHADSGRASKWQEMLGRIGKDRRAVAFDGRVPSRWRRLRHVPRRLEHVGEHSARRQGQPRERSREADQGRKGLGPAPSDGARAPADTPPAHAA